VYGRAVSLLEPSAAYARLVLAVEAAVDDVARLRTLAREVRACAEISEDERDDLLTRAAWYEHGCHPEPVEPSAAT
jgi:hypothetical protein